MKFSAQRNRSLQHPSRRPNAAPRVIERSVVDAILGAAAAQFASSGFGAVSTREIADAAGVTHAALLEQFPRKEAILEGLVQKSLRKSLEHLQRIQNCAATPAARLYRAVHDEVGAIAGANPLKPLLDLPELRRPQFAHLAAQRRALTAWYKRCINEGIASGDFIACDSVYLGWLVNGIGETAYDRSDAAPILPAVEHARAIADFAVRAILRKPQKLAAVRREAERLGPF